MPDLGDAPWIVHPSTRAVLDALEAAGGTDCARFVGGCVRNTLRGAAVDDIDIATILEPQAVIAALEAAGLKAVPTGVEHGTVTAISGRRPFEITTLRRDVETDGRRAVVAFTTDWSEDAARRDFTMNALYADRAGAIFDPVGGGVDDALAGRVVFVGDPATRLAEDYLRALRFFRFQAWYGLGAPDAAGLAACAAVRDRLTGLAAERISKELLKLLAAPDPRASAAAMAETGVLAVLLPESGPVTTFETMTTISPDPLLRLAALLPDAPSAGAAATRLRLSNAQRDRLVAALGPAEALEPAMSAAALRRLAYRLGPVTTADRLRLAWARRPEAGEAWARLASEAERWTPPVLPVTGEDAMAAGAARGPAVGAALRAVEDWWVARDFADGREATLAKLAAEVRELKA